MANISDIIEQFIMQTIGEDEKVMISRNQLAEHFDCAPSQINYVLSTRFNEDRGFITFSKRGGGGYIEITKVTSDKDGYLSRLLCESIGSEISYTKAMQILDKLYSEDIITSKEKKLILAGISDKALSAPIIIKDKLRSQIFKNIILELYNEEK